MRRNCRAFLDLNALRACDQLGRRRVEIGVMSSDTAMSMYQAHTVICDVELARRNHRNALGADWKLSLLIVPNIERKKKEYLPCIHNRRNTLEPV